VERRLLGDAARDRAIIAKDGQTQFQRNRRKDVIIIQMNDHDSGGHLSPLIAGVWLLLRSIIPYYLDLCAEPPAQGLDIPGRLRAIVHNHDLPVRISLIPYAGQGLAEQSRSIVGWNDDGYAGRHSGCDCGA
jgi:hypothetical protein